jgi:hypothetical protein
MKCRPEIVALLLVNTMVAAGCGDASKSSPDGGIDGGTDAGTDGDADSDADGDSDGDADSDSDADGDAGTEPDAGDWDAGAKDAGDTGSAAVCDQALFDAASQLSWQLTPSGGDSNWQPAVNYCDTLILCGHADWRLPTVSELRSFIRGCDATETGGACGVGDECLSDSCAGSECAGCAEDLGPDDGCYRPIGIDGDCRPCWSSSEATGASAAWYVDFPTGLVGQDEKTAKLRTRCVRTE